MTSQLPICVATRKGPFDAASSGVAPPLPRRYLSGENSLLGSAALPPTLRLETPIGHDSETRRWIYDLFCTVSRRFSELGISAASVGELDTLFDRLEAELDATRSYAACIGLVGAWSRKPDT